MTEANQVAQGCAGASAYTLLYGYSFVGKEQKTFPQGKLEKERRNKDGRVTYARYNYLDGSALVFTYRKNGYPNLEVVQPPQPKGAA